MIMIHEGRKSVDLSGIWTYRYESELEKESGLSGKIFMPKKERLRMGGRKLQFQIIGI